MNCYWADGPNSIEKQDVHGDTYWYHPLVNEWPKTTAAAATVSTGAARATADQADRVYRELQGQLSLSTKHLRALENRGLTAKAAQAHGFKSMPAAAAVRADVAKSIADLFPFWLGVPGFYQGEGKARLAVGEGLAVFGHSVDGRLAAVQIRRDNPSEDGSRYYWMSSTKHGGPGAGSPATLWEPKTGAAVANVVRICEGALKAVIAAELTGVAGIAAGSVGTMASPQVLEMLQQLAPAIVLFAPDQSAFYKAAVLRQVRVCLARLMDQQSQLGFELRVETWADELPPENRPDGIDDALSAGFETRTLAPVAYLALLPAEKSQSEKGHAVPDPTEWEEPLPLEGPPPKPVFPVDCLPDCAREFALAVSEAYQVPVSYAANLILGAASIGLSKRVVVDGGRGPATSLNEWFLTVLESGSGKSTSLHVVKAPIYAHERQMVAQAQTPEGGTNYVGLVSSDPTPEALEGRLRANEGRYALVNAEAADLFSILAGRYTQSGTANIGLFLKAYSGENHRSDRVMRGKTYIDEPRLTLSLSLQPKAWERVSRSDEFRDRGLIARFLLDVPDSLLGHRKPDPTPVSRESRDAWDNLMRSLLSIDPPRENEEPQPFCINVSPQGQMLLKKFRVWAEAGLRPDGCWEECREFGARAAEHLLKLAGLLHCLSSPRAPWDRPLSEGTMQTAATLFDYYAQQTRIASGGVRQNVETVRLSYLLKRITSKAEWRESFTVRDLWQLVKGRGGIRTTDDLLRDLHRLEAYGYLQVAGLRGRSVRCRVSPYVFSGKTPPAPPNHQDAFPVGLKSVGEARPHGPPSAPSPPLSLDLDPGVGATGGGRGQEPPSDLSLMPSASHGLGGNGGDFEAGRDGQVQVPGDMF